MFLPKQIRTLPSGAFPTSHQGLQRQLCAFIRKDHAPEGEEILPIFNHKNRYTAVREQVINSTTKVGARYKLVLTSLITLYLAFIISEISRQILHRQKRSKV